MDFQLPDVESSSYFNIHEQIYISRCHFDRGYCKLKIKDDKWNNDWHIVLTSFVLLISRYSTISITSFIKFYAICNSMEKHTFLTGQIITYITAIQSYSSGFDCVLGRLVMNANWFFSSIAAAFGIKGKEPSQKMTIMYSKAAFFVINRL